MSLDTASPETLKRLTGLERPSAVRRFLDKQKPPIPYMLGADGWPRVLQVILVARLGGQVAPLAPEPRMRFRNG